MIANVYVDGFNLYYGVRRWPGSRWLDIGKLSRTLFPDDTIHRIRYFTANVSGKLDPGSPRRQQTYLKALRTIPELEIVTGNFIVSHPWMPFEKPCEDCLLRGQIVTKTEEKGSDVNLAMGLLLDAVDSDCEMAVVISNDSDLREPIKTVQKRFGIPVWVVNPHKHRTNMGSERHLDLRRGTVQASLFPEVIPLPNGKAIRCPDRWKTPKIP